MSEKLASARKASAVSLIPRLAKLLYRLARDRRVPWRAKAALVGMAAYLACPLDLIPDWIPGAGYLDDVLIVGLTLSYVFARVPEELIAEHWGEDLHVPESLRRMRGGRDKR